MKILVTCKRIPDPEEHLRFAGDAVDYSASKFVANAFDEYAVETALRLAEHVGGSERLAEVIVVSICKADQRQHLTQFLAMGADRGIIVDADDAELDSQTIARALAKVAEREGTDLVVTGKLSQDNEGNQIGQRVAALLARPQACFAAEIEWKRDANQLVVQREVDDGVETKKVPLPAVITVDLRVVLPKSVRNGATSPDHAYNEGARLASLRGITMAKRKKVDVFSLADLGVSATRHERTVGVHKPAGRAAGQRVASVEELVAKLATEAKVL